MTRWIIVGISGATCSGKTTLSKKLRESLDNVTLINQDSYFRPVDDPHHVLIPELNHFNWDILSSLDMEKMYSDILKIIKSSPSEDHKTSILIIDGFQIFNHKPIADLCSIKYFLYLEKDVCFKRRKDREYDPPDVPGYFDKIVWPEYEKYREDIINNKSLHDSIIFIDGSKEVDESFNTVLKNIHKNL